MYLVLKAGNDPNFQVPKGLTDENGSQDNDIRFTARERALNRRRRGRDIAPVKSKLELDWMNDIQRVDYEEEGETDFPRQKDCQRFEVYWQKKTYSLLVVYI